MSIQAATNCPLLCGPQNEFFCCAFEYGGDNVTPSDPKSVEAHEQRIKQREKIASAVSKLMPIEKIPVVEYPVLCSLDHIQKMRSGKLTGMQPGPCTGYMNELEQIEFPQGTSVLQTEDPAGRKALVLRLEDRSNSQIRIETIFQRYRETCTGSCWLSKVLDPYPDSSVDKIAQQLDLLIKNEHPTYTLKA